MTRRDGGLRFWLGYVESRDGLWEPAGDSVLAVLPTPLAEEANLPEEVLVSSDPDVAREDGVTFLATGHPLIAKAAEAVLAKGDVGVLTLARPRSVPPDSDTLLNRARDRFPVDHGRIDLVTSTSGVRPVLRVGALVSYAVSAEDHFQERVECWVDVPGRAELPDQVSARLAQTEPAGDREDRDRSGAAGVEGALAEAYRLVEATAIRREQALATQASDGHRQERERAEGYYQAALDSLERRRATAPPDRARLLGARAKATSQERARRLVEIEEKYQPRHEIRPYRLHLVRVPVLRLSVDVRRGERRYPMTLDWLLPAGEFADVRCPNCGARAPLVAARTLLGCTSCQVAKPAASSQPVAPVRPTGSAKRAGSVGSGANTKPASPKVRPAKPGPAKSKPAMSKPAGSKPAVAGRAGSSDAPDRAQRQRARPRATGADWTRIFDRSVPADGAGERLAVSFWQCAVGGEQRKLTRMCAPDSPAAALVRLYGAPGPLWAVGVRPGEAANSITTMGYPGGAFGLEAVGGELVTRTSQHSYMLRWLADDRDHLVVEVLPFNSPFGMRFVSGLFGGRAAGPRPLRALPRPPAFLDPVADVLWAMVPRRHGTTVLLRALAAWWRVPEDIGLHHLYPAPVLAAALERAICYWSMLDGGTYAAVAAAYGLDEASIRQANTRLQKHLSLTRDNPW